MKAQTVHICTHNKNNKTVFIQFLPIKSCIQHYKKRKYVRYFVAKFLISWYTICMKENLIHYRTCVCNINYHMVWSVKYRRKILNAEVEAYLQELVQEIAEDKGFMVHLFERR